MSAHRYSLGEIVCLQSRTRMARSTPETFEVTALLPPSQGVNQYRVRNELERHERVVREDEIGTVRDIAANSNVPAGMRNK